MKIEKIIYLILKVLLSILGIISLVIFSLNVFRLNIIPDKQLFWFYIIYIVTILIILLLIFNLFRKSKLYTKIISAILLVIISIGLMFVGTYFETTYAFLKRTQVKYDTLSYSVIVLNDSDVTKIKDLKNSSVAYLKDIYTESIEEELNKKISYDEVIASDLSKLVEILNNKEVKAIILEESYITLAKEEIEDFETNTKVIYTFKVRVKAYKEDNTINVSQEPFIIYISGIDQWGNVNSVRGRSDVNQLLVINPKTHKILIVNTPRDYYVQLAGTTGLRDKLTHAGIYGIEKSIATINNLYDININHYIRINFDSLVKIVDVIGGIDVYSDRTFNSFHIKGWVVPEGLNHFDGKQALAYSRERYAYRDGDHHRGRNQQQVIEAIIEKLTSTSTLLSKYNSILNSLDGTFQTDMDISLITSFIKYQLGEMPKWEIESVQAYGYNSWGYTYSMGYNYYLWVMEPDWNSIATIKNKIAEVLEG